MALAEDPPRIETAFQIAKKTRHNSDFDKAGRFPVGSKAKV